MKSPSLPLIYIFKFSLSLSKLPRLETISSTTFVASCLESIFTPVFCSLFILILRLFLDSAYF
nr:MAG TPA: hypothetical protein [Caudoviricetes sp.]